MAIKIMSAPLVTFLAISVLVVGIMDDMVMWYSAPRAIFCMALEMFSTSDAPSTIIRTSMGPLTSIINLTYYLNLKPLIFLFCQL